MPSLTVLVELEIQELDRLASSSKGNSSVFSIGKELSTFLLSLDETHSSTTISNWLTDRLRAFAPGPVVCADIDLLFHPILQIDPLALFRHISRYRKLLVLWPGEHKDGTLSYAQPEHQHYRFWKDLQNIEITGVNDAL